MSTPIEARSVSLTPSPFGLKASGKAFRVTIGAAAGARPDAEAHRPRSANAQAVTTKSFTPSPPESAGARTALPFRELLLAEGELPLSLLELLGAPVEFL